MKIENQLLNRVLKAVKLKDSTPENEAVVEAVEALVEAPEMEAAAEVTEQLSQMRIAEAKAEQLAAELATAVNALTEMTAARDAAQAALDALSAEKAEMLANAAEAKMAARKEKVVLAIGTEKAEGLMLATQGLDDAAFEAVVSALVGSVEAEASTSLFSEVGVSASVDASKIDAESPEMKIIRQKFSGAK